MTKLDWEKAKRNEATRAQRSLRGPSKAQKRRHHLRQVAMAQFAKKHDLVCFVCNDPENQWAKTGISKRGPWAICVDCVGVKKR